MTNYIEIERFRKDPRATSDLARRLLAAPDGTFDTYERDFLVDIVVHKAPRAVREIMKPLTTRQIEWLIDLRDGLRYHRTTPQGFSVPLLIEQSWMNRLDLDADEHIEFLERIRGHKSLRMRQLRLLLHISRKLGVIEAYV